MNKDVPNIKSEPSYEELLDHAKKLFGNDEGNLYLQKLQSASDEDVNVLHKEMQKKYKQMAIKFHPDKNVNKEVEEKASAEAKFKEINEAKDFFTKFFEEYTKEKESVKKFKSQEDKKSFNDFAKGKTRQSISSDGLDVFWAEFLRTQRQQQEQQRQEQQRHQQQQQQQQQNQNSSPRNIIEELLVNFLRDLRRQREQQKQQPERQPWHQKETKHPETKQPETHNHNKNQNFNPEYPNLRCFTAFSIGGVIFIIQSDPLNRQQNSQGSNEKNNSYSQFPPSASAKINKINSTKSDPFRNAVNEGTRHSGR